MSIEGELVAHAPRFVAGIAHAIGGSMLAMQYIRRVKLSTL